jgi:hypothetical protein
LSRSLAALERDKPKRPRAHLYAVIQQMIAVEPQGFLKDDANIVRLCALAALSRASYYRHFRPHPPKREDATCATSSSALPSKTAIAAIGGSLRRSGAKG